MNPGNPIPAGPWYGRPSPTIVERQHAELLAALGCETHEEALATVARLRALDVAGIVKDISTFDAPPSRP